MRFNLFPQENSAIREECPFLYRINRLWGYQPGLTEYLGYGKALHHCMRVAAEQMKEGYSPISAVANAVDKQFYLPFAEEGRHHKLLKETAKRKLIQFAREREDDMLRIKRWRRIEYPLQRATVVGKIDVILHDEGGIEIRDYKSSDVVTSQEEVTMQLQLYANGLTRLGETVTRGIGGLSRRRDSCPCGDRGRNHSRSRRNCRATNRWDYARSLSTLPRQCMWSLRLRDYL